MPRDFVTEPSDSVTTSSNRGVELGYAERTSLLNSTVVNSYEDVPLLSVTVTVTDRPILIEFFTPSVSHSAANGNALVKFVEGATQLSFAQMGGLAAANGVPIYMGRRIAASAGSHTYKVQWGSNNAGTHTLNADPLYPAYLLVREV